MYISKLGITPGPWTYEKEAKHEGYIRGAKDFRVAFYTIMPHDERNQEAVRKRIETNTHNARLIAAAPEMLEALIKSEIMDEKLFGGNDFDNQKIIEKATGRTWAEVKDFIDER